MKVSHIVDVAKKMIRKASASNSPGLPSILRLDMALPARTPSEDMGDTRVEALELYPRVLHTVRAPGISDLKNTIVLGIDSSSRIVDTPSATIIVASVSVTSNKPLHNGFLSSGDWPPLYERSIPGLREPFITVIPHSDDYVIDGDDSVTNRNPAGIEYTEDYNLFQAMDEARVRLENKALLALADTLSSHKTRGELVVLVDGPLYLVTGALTRPGIPQEYRTAWMHLYRERLKAVSMLEEAGARVYGVVKRIEMARLLHRDPTLEGLIRRCLGESRYTDKLVLYKSLEKPACRKPIPPNGMYALASSPLKVEYQGLEAEKVAQYVVIPQPRWAPNSHASRYYRVEESYSSWEERGRRWNAYKSPAAGLLLDSVARGSLEPLTIACSDRRAKSITAYLKQVMITEAARRNVPISYSNELEVYQAWARVGA